jgi:class 3 adenylate cyclase
MKKPTPKPKHSRLAKLPTCAILDTLLIERVEHPERMKAIDKKIKQQFEKTAAVMVLDMSGFSRLVQRYGIIHYLAMIRRMRRVVAPVIARHSGVVIKFEADNCFAVFPKADDAVGAALEINHDMDVANLATPDESDVYVCIGLGFGPTLLACDDLYGNELNLAAKLGEDVAEKSEVLATDAIKKNCKKTWSMTSFPLTISGVTLKGWKVKR